MSDKQTAVAAVTQRPVTDISATDPFMVVRAGVPAVSTGTSFGLAGTRGAAAASTGRYARADWDRTADITIGVAGTTADEAGRRIPVTRHNSTFRGRPRGRPV